ncbi:50S ribosomal protein L1 [Salmonella enterica subsp. enterica]|uniref:50S ribosomal protein L1 n=1 Tax=Salmonella enterica I TaxID=59201 RepID=A0A379UTZ3_SALET|nr:50S ribosomal protein L1 [Salmonella enterica subsp. enterica]
MPLPVTHPSQWSMHIRAPLPAVSLIICPPYGYILDLHETDIPGINKEFTVYYRNGAYIAGTFWIANSMTIASERIVGMNGVSKQAYPIFNKSLQQCANPLINKMSAPRKNKPT